MASLVIFVVVVVAGGAILTAASLAGSPAQARSWWALAFQCATAQVVCAFVVLRVSEGSLLLYRDFAALALVAALCTLGVATALRLVRERGVSLRVLLAVSIMIFAALLSPFVGLVVHCTSGDCI